MGTRPQKPHRDDGTETPATVENKNSPNPGPFFHKFFTPVPDLETRNMQNPAEVDMAHRIRGHLCFAMCIQYVRPSNYVFLTYCTSTNISILDLTRK